MICALFSDFGKKLLPWPIQLNHKIILSDAYQRRLGEIEDFIWESSGKNILALEAFLTAHYHVLKFLKDNPTTPAPHSQTGDLSWLK